MKNEDKQRLKQRQSLPMKQKLLMTKSRIKEWCEHWDYDVYLSFSGGKDSTVLKHIIETMGINIPCVFSNTGLEMPEIVDFARRQKNVIEVRPKKNFKEAWDLVGIPIGSKKIARQIRTLKAGPTGNGSTYKLYDEGITSDGHSAPSWKIPNKWRKLIDSDLNFSEQCCDFLKKEPIKTYEKENNLKGRGFTAVMASEGGYRSELTKCNVYEGSSAKSHPMLFWNDNDVWEYINENSVEICSVYFDRECELNGEKLTISGEKRTGCMFCGFGAHLEEFPNRFQRMEITHPRQHRIIVDRMGMGKVMEMIDVSVSYSDGHKNKSKSGK